MLHCCFFANRNIAFPLNFLISGNTLLPEWQREHAGERCRHEGIPLISYANVNNTSDKGFQFIFLTV